VARLVLVGLPGTGKTSTGAVVAEALHCDAIDLDARFRDETGQSAGDYIRIHGEGAFREIEMSLLREAVELDAVVSTGGGIVTTPAAREILSRERCVWLDAPDKVLLPRLAHGDRPLLGDTPGVRLHELRTERSPWYEEVATIKVDTSRSPRSVARAVLEAIGVEP
jgi:shikimate kinase